ncbi:MAG: MBL fold metallo-hydrolase [Clostridia bacterium]|nr:MBL fold metallo-hydrolase [Clostridia bacterium]MBQ7348292.1 MBL fold metallo-hydrolase [Clostridia bacterium]
MKNILARLALLLTLCLTVTSVMISCHSGDSKPNGTTDGGATENGMVETENSETESETLPQDETPRLPTNNETVLNLALDGDTPYTILYSRKSGSWCSDAAYDLADRLEELVGDKNVTVMSDRYYATKETESKLIFVGNSTAPEAENFANAVGYGEYGYYAAGERICILGWTSETLSAAMDDFCDLLADHVTEADGKKSISLQIEAPVINAKKNFDVNVEKLADSTDAYTLANNNILVLANNGTAEAFHAYAAKLEQKGYTKTMENTIGSNLYRAYKNDTYAVYVYYTAAENMIRMVGATLTNARQPVFGEASADGTVSAKLAVINMDYDGQASKDNGMGLVFTLDDGSYLIYDSGYNANDAKTLYNYLKDNNKRTDGKIVIEGWFVTHGHEDHYGALEQFSSLYSTKVTVKTFYFNPVTWASETDTMLTLGNTLKRKFDGCTLATPHTGMKLQIRNATVEVLYTHEDRMPNAINSLNDASVVSRVTVGEKTVLITGDIQQTFASDILVKNFGSYLKSDVFQVPHHGDSGGTKALYALVDPTAVIYTTAQNKFEERKLASWPPHNIPAPNYYLLNELHVKDVYVADGYVKEIDLTK